MRFIDVLLTNSTLKEAKLYGPAFKASEDPTIGITIHNQAAFHVIKDCAKITQKYLPFIVLEHYTDVFDSLRGKITSSDIQDFVQASKKDYSCRQLLIVLLDKIYKKFPYLNEQNTTQRSAQPTIDFNASDPYGDYGNAIQTHVGNKLSEEEIIIKAFS